MTRVLQLGSSFGVMQGRLSRQTARGYQAFPVETWAQEFHLAQSRGFEHIEWIIDNSANWTNPLLVQGETVRRVSAETGVAVLSVCGDYFMDHPLDVDRASTFEILDSVFQAMRSIGAQYFVLPCVDQSSLLTQDSLSRLKSALPHIMDLASKYGVAVALEADLPPKQFAEVLDEYPSETLGVNYDSGNSASLGYRWADERIAYGDRISLVHVKDRLLNGGSVPLGAGNADLPGLLGWVRDSFRGPVTMQAFRDTEGLGILDDQVDWLKALVEAPS